MDSVNAWVDAVNCMYAGYVKAFLWAESPLPMGEEDEVSDASLEDLGYTPYHLDPDAVRFIRSDCAKLYHLITDSDINALADLWEQVGVDLHLTRQGHGSGFWDRPELYGKEQAERLTQLVHENFRPVYAEIDDTDYIQIIAG